MTGRMRGVLARINRLAALRIARAYRTVSGDAATLAGSIPLDLLARERAQLWLIRNDGSSAEDQVRREEETRAETLSRWQERWTADNGKAAWTKLLLPNVKRWLGSGGSGRLSFHLTQAVTGHGCFNSYLFRFGKTDSPSCWWCPDVVDDPAHTLFVCDRFADETRN